MAFDEKTFQDFYESPNVTFAFLEMLNKIAVKVAGQPIKVDKYMFSFIGKNY